LRPTAGAVSPPRPGARRPLRTQRCNAPGASSPIDTGGDSVPVVLQGSSTGFTPPAPPAHPLDTGPEEEGRHPEQNDDPEGRPKPAIGVGTEPPDHGLLNDERGQHRARPEQRSTSHDWPSSFRRGLQRKESPR